MTRYIAWFAMLLLLSACSDSDFKKPKYLKAERPTLETTISADGKLVATLDRIGTKNPRIRIKWIDKDDPWQELPAPMFADSIRFGLKGYGLLLTHALPGQAPDAQLTRWDISDLSKPSEALYIGPNLAYPLEAQPDHFMVRVCKPYDGEVGKCRTDWLMISADGSAVQVSPKNRSLIYSQPNVTPDGFFWFDQFEKIEAQPDRRSLLAYSWPGRNVPNLDAAMLNRWTTNLVCDYQTVRCLHRYLAGKNSSNGRFIYDIEIFHGKQRCRPEGLTGWSDGQSVTPDGRFAVMSLSTEVEDLRHVVVMQFKPGQCEPLFIKNFDF